MKSQHPETTYKAGISSQPTGFLNSSVQAMSKVAPELLQIPSVAEVAEELLPDISRQRRIIIGITIPSRRNAIFFAPKQANPYPWLVHIDDDHRKGRRTIMRLALIDHKKIAFLLYLVFFVITGKRLPIRGLEQHMQCIPDSRLIQQARFIPSLYLCRILPDPG